LKKIFTRWFVELIFVVNILLYRIFLKRVSCAAFDWIPNEMCFYIFLSNFKYGHFCLILYFPKQLYLEIRFFTLNIVHVSVVTWCIVKWHLLRKTEKWFPKRFLNLEVRWIDAK
jgi:hypothetical protein